MRRCTSHALYRSKLRQQDHCQHTKNANPYSSTLKDTAQRIGRRFGGDGAEAQGWGHCQENPDQGVHRKGPGNRWWNSLAVWWSWLWQQGSAHAHKSKKTQAWLQKECYDFVPFYHWPPPPLTWTRWTTSFGHTSRTSPTWTPTRTKPASSPPSAEYSPSSRQRLWKRHAPNSGSISRRSLRLKAATLNRCQYIT